MAKPTHLPLDSLMATLIDGVPARAIPLLLSWILNHDDRHHAKYPSNPEVFAVSTKVLKRACGGGSTYKRVIERFFDNYDDDFKPGKYTRAYTLKPGALAELEALDGQLVELGKPEATHQVSIRAGALADLHESTDSLARLWGRSLSRRAQADPANPGLATLHERYEQLTEAGRRFAVGPSIQGLPRALRGRLLGGLGYVDVDIVNAHPNLLRQVVPGLPMLEDYCANRDDWLGEIQQVAAVSRDAAKELMLKLTYGAALGGPAVMTWLEQHKVGNDVVPPRRLTDFIDEIRLARVELLDLFDGALTKGTPKLRAMALILQQQENDVLEALEAFHLAQGDEVAVLMFDGYLVRPKGEGVPLASLQRVAFAATGFHLQFTAVPV